MEEEQEVEAGEEEEEEGEGDDAENAAQQVHNVNLQKNKELI